MDTDWHSLEGLP